MPGAIPSATAPSLYGSRQTVQVGDIQNAPCGFVECDSGKLLFIYNPSASHAGSGSIAIKSAANETAALAGAFSSATVITAEGSAPGEFYYGDPRLTKITQGAHAGRIWAAYTRATLPSGSAYCCEFKFTDNEGVSWSAPINPTPVFTATTGEFMSGPILELPNGDLVASPFGWDTADPTRVRVKCIASTDDGATWGLRSTIVASGSASYGETNLLNMQLTDGSWQVGCFTIDETAYPSGSFHVWLTSDDSCATWTNHGAKAISGGGSPVGAHPSAIQPLDGSVLMLFRAVGLDPNKTYWARSTDRVATLTSLGQLEATGNMRYGQFQQLASGRVGLCYATETTITNAAVYFKVFTLASYTPATPNEPLTLDADADWTQVGSVLTVTGATVGVRASVTGTAYSAGGGEMVFDGVHADRFWLSLDGSTWTHTITIPAGYTTVHLSVLPTGGETSFAGPGQLDARVGVPL